MTRFIIISVGAAVAIFLAWYVIRLIDTVRNGLAPDIGTPTDILPEIYRYLALKPGSVMYEPGCGDGRVLRYCASKQPQARFIGLENGILQYTKAKWATRNLQNVTIKFGDFRTAKYSGATCFYLYLLPEALDLIKPKLPKRSRIVTCQFPLSKRKSIKTIQLDGGHALAKQLFIY